MRTDIITPKCAKALIPILDAEFKKNGLRYVTYYYSSKTKPYVATICAAVATSLSFGSLVYRGISLTAENDSPCKAIGRVYAMRRVLRVFKHGDTEQFSPRVEPIIISVYDACTTPLMLLNKCTVTKEPTEFERQLLKL